MYVIFEGIDGAGKSTQIARLAAAFPQAIVTKEPGGTKLGEAVRSLVLGEDFSWRGGSANLREACGEISKRAEMLLFLADRAEHYERVIKTNADKLVLSDRGFISGLAYALANDENADFGELIMLNKFVLGGKLADKIVLFNADEQLVRQRLKTRVSSDVIEARGLKYLIHVQELMKQVARSCDIETLNIDASEPIEKISQKIKEFILA